ncbi:uncharacterized protein FA14DRAFT_7531 [Meira miltonrushii]|uniref:Uncharacterized protein n=1 Tax=Meira miltonrushii TaxID=1280837 RepID=A0A316VH74_9BASI|nr:uncharacterized protein FA14DRAFT_7531 [Meira miltonrushii]PWN36870.1 hypothetical protein FA14DRAFT_7531 [Meira miltonrushii]
MHCLSNSGVYMTRSLPLDHFGNAAALSGLKSFAYSLLKSHYRSSPTSCWQPLSSNLFVMLRMQLIVIFVILRSLAHCASINTDHTVQPPNQNAASQSQSNTVHINPIPAGRRRSYPSNRSREYLVSKARLNVCLNLSRYQPHLYLDGCRACYRKTQIQKQVSISIHWQEYRVSQENAYRYRSSKFSQKG